MESLLDHTSDYNAAAINAAKIIFVLLHKHYTTFAFKLWEVSSHVLLAPQEA